MRPDVAALMVAGALAAPTVAAQSAADDNLLVEGREMVRSFTESVARRVDGWFGDKPFEEGGKVSGNIGFKFLSRQYEGTDKNITFGARLDLPNVKDKAYLFFGRENEDELVSDQPEEFRRRQLLLPEDPRRDQTLFAGVGFALRDLFDFRAGVRGGYRVYAQARYRKEWQLGPSDAIALRETLFWKPSDGFGSTTSLNYSHALSPSVALRWLNAATNSQDTDGWTWSTSAGVYKYFGKDHSVSLEAIVSGAAHAQETPSEYAVRAVWERPIYRDWTILELTVGHFWPQGNEDDARRHWAFGLGVDILF